MKPCHAHPFLLAAILSCAGAPWPETETRPGAATATPLSFDSAIHPDLRTAQGRRQMRHALQRDEDERLAERQRDAERERARPRSVCEHAYIDQVQFQALVATSSIGMQISWPGEQAFLADCAELDTETQRCLLLEYRRAHLDVCRRKLETASATTEGTGPRR